MTPIQSSRSFVVLGAGVVGLAVARELARRGASVRLLERGRIGAPGPASSASLGLLVPPPHRRSLFGRLLRIANAGYEELAREIEEESGCRVGYHRPGGLYLVTDEPPSGERRRRVDAYRSAGLDARWVDSAELAARLPGVSAAFSGALLLPEEAMVDPASLLDALARCCRQRGVEIVEDCGELRIDPSGVDRVIAAEGRSCGLDRSGATLIVASGAWSSRVVPDEAADSVPLTPVRGQAIELAVDLAGAPVAHFEATDGRGYYAQPKTAGDGARATWVGATTEEVGFDARATAAGEDQLRAAFRDLFPERPRAESVPRRVWAGLRPRADRRGGPFLGPLPGRDDVWILAGHYKSGIALGPLTARLLAERLCGEACSIEREGVSREDLEQLAPGAGPTPGG